MHLRNYNLKVKGKSLLEDTELNFEPGIISHILGKNGVGKSQLAKDFLLNNSGLIPKTISSNVTIISSFSNIPEDISTKILIKLLARKYNIELINRLCSLLNMSNIPRETQITNLSDGQKQKIKIMTFLLENKGIIILDEITNSLDKSTVNEIHTFLNYYIENNKNKIIINITHNLSDLNNVQGDYYLLFERKIIKFNDKELIIKKYIEDWGVYNDRVNEKYFK